MRLLDDVIRRSYWYHGIFGHCAKFWNLKEEEYFDVVNLGSSSALHAFDYTNLPINAANWAMSPQGLYADGALLQKYGPSHISKGKGVVLIPLCPFSSISGDISYQMPRRYYSLLDAEQVLQYSEKERMMVMDMKEHPWNYFPKTMGQFKQEVKSFCGLMSKAVSSQDISVNARQWVENWMREFGISNLEEPLTSRNCKRRADSVITLKGIIRTCEQLNVNPVLVIPPISEALAFLFTPKVLQIYIYDFIKEAELDNIKLIDYWWWKIDNSCFHDAYFLNSKGAKLFTHRLLSDLNLLITF